MVAKGYFGTQAAQIWMYNLDDKSFKKVATPERGCTNALWKPDGNGCYLVSSQDGAFNLYEHDFTTGNDKQLTKFPDDSVVQPCISKDGKTIVFRHLFDFYRYEPGSNLPPEKLTITASGDRQIDPIDRRVLSQATEVAFSNDGLEVAFLAGGDVWVMDTELREPKQVTTSVEHERDLVMSPDGQYVYFITDMYGETNIWRAERADKAKYWWQNSEFKLRRITQTKADKNNIKLSPDGSKIGYLCNRGDLCVMDADGKNCKTVVKSFSPVEFDWSPDGKWLVYAAEDDDFNRDIWITPLDGSRPAYNVSRNPFNDGDPTWSPDGKIIAYVGRSTGEEMDIHYVYLRLEDDQTSSRERTLEKALDKMNRDRRPAPRVTEDARQEEEPVDQAPPRGPSGAISAAGGATAEKVAVTIDFDQLHERVHVITNADATERGLFWSPDGKKLAFNDSRTTSVVDFPDDLRPKPLNPGIGTQARWLRSGQIVWLAANLPASFPVAGGAPTAAAASAPAGARPGGGRGPRGAGGATAPEASEAAVGTSYRFQALQVVNRPQKNAATFDLAWRTMRDNYYDERLGNRDWDAIRHKYFDMAKDAPDPETVAVVVNLMLGELNGSHLGFYGNDNLPASLRRNAPAGTEPPAVRWTESTVNLGIRFDPNYAGPGLKVRDIIAHGPADKVKTRVKPGDIITAIDEHTIEPGMDLTRVLTVRPGHEFTLKVKSGETEKTVTIQPIAYTAARQLLYKQWTVDNAKKVEKLSDGKLGYLHIDAMAMPSFYKFQAELFSIGAGKDGLVIDVRENGGGSTADHLLTSLAQPVHAITVPRGGGPGYPQDRKIYACWNKPIVVMCNQNSFSNAEIFAHAIKNLKRGHVVGVQTAGGVISTGGTQIMDVGFLRLPFRGWFSVIDGRDMELNGAMPDFVLWPEPTQMPAGKDVQLEKAVSVLGTDVAQWNARPQPRLIKASESEPSKKDRPLVREATGQ